MTDSPERESGPASPPPTGAAGPVRPSTTERQAVAQHLLTAVNEGRIELAEYERRLRASEVAGTTVELQRLAADLPAPPSPPSPPATPAHAEQVLLQVGDMTVTQSVIHTPVGPVSVRGSQWLVQDQWLEYRKIPTWAIVLSIVGFFCLTIFSLLFLLIKESYYQGTVDVTVTNGDRQYTSRIPVLNQQQVQYVYQQVNYVRMLATR